VRRTGAAVFAVRRAHPSQPASTPAATTQAPTPRPLSSRTITRQPVKTGRSVAASSTTPQEGHRYAVTRYDPPSPSQRTRLLPATANQWPNPLRVVVRSAPDVIASWQRGHNRVCSDMTSPPSFAAERSAVGKGTPTGTSLAPGPADGSRAVRNPWYLARISAFFHAGKQHMAKRSSIGQNVCPFLFDSAQMRTIFSRISASSLCCRQKSRARFSARRIVFCSQ
jgi:hypothetical protein